MNQKMIIMKKNNVVEISMETIQTKSLHRGARAKEAEIRINITSKLHSIRSLSKI